MKAKRIYIRQDSILNKVLRHYNAPKVLVGAMVNGVRHAFWFGLL